MQKIFSWSVLFFLLLIFTTVFTQICFAQSATSSVVINEVFPAPSSGNEWVELFNSGDSPVTLDNFTLEDQLIMPSLLFKFAQNTQLQPQTYIVIEINAKLNNTADGVVLRDAAGNVIDRMLYASSQSDRSFARLLNGLGNFVLSLPSRGVANLGNPTPTPSPAPSVSPSPVVTPTPSPSSSPVPSPIPTPTPSPSLSPSPSPSLTPSPSPTPVASASPTPQPSPTPGTLPDSLIISEIYACPDTNESEWVEVYNPDQVSYTLTNWRFKDSIGNVRSFTATLPGQNYTTIPLSSAMLNNDGDQVSLEQPNGVSIDIANFPSCTKGTSFIWYNGSWQATSTVTKNAANSLGLVIPSSDSTDVTSVASDSASTSILGASSSSDYSSQSWNFIPTTGDLPTTSEAPYRPYSLATLQALLKTASESAESSVASFSATQENQEVPSSKNTATITQPTHRTQFSKYLTLGFLLLGCIFLGLSTVAFYKWYTVQREEKDFELV